MTRKNLFEQINRLSALKAEIEHRQQEADELAKAIKAEMQKLNAGELDTGIVTVTYKTVKTSRLNNAALKAAHSKIYARFMETGETMRFTVKAHSTASAAPALQIVGAA